MGDGILQLHLNTLDEEEEAEQLAVARASLGVQEQIERRVDL